MRTWLERWWRPLLAVSVTLHVLSLFGDLAEPDAALYAHIARVMAETGDWVNLIAYNVDWLDKPHFPFWVTAVAFKLFGVSVVTARLPALLFTALGAIYTWRLGVKLYDTTVARLAVLVLLTSQHLVMSSSDVRAEPFLVGLLTAAVFHALCARESKWLGHLVLASAFTAAAMMTKGPFLLFPVACVAVLPALFKREPLRLGRWVLAISLVAVFLTPELGALWLQFDSHPEKLIFDRHDVSGLRWFFWDSQFGRFANTGPIRGAGDPSFFFHTVLWSFLPWSLALYVAAFTRARRDLVVWSAALPTLLLFSASRFQLPHYLNILFPFFALAVAAWWSEAQVGKRAAVMQGVAMAAMLGFVVWLVVLFQVPHLPVVLTLLALGTALVIALFRKADMGDAFGRSVGAAALMHGVLLLSYNPVALRYQVGREAAALANTLPPKTTVMVDVSSHGFAFHLTGRALWWTLDDLRVATSPVRALGPASKFETLKSEGYLVQEVKAYEYFHASRPSVKFLDSATRSEVLERWLLVEVSKPP